MKEKFSEGPWSVYGDWGICFSGDRECYVTVESRGEGPKYTGELFANLNLIAAAPEMYAMLNEWLDNGYLHRGDVEKLLAEARGE